MAVHRRTRNRVVSEVELFKLLKDSGLAAQGIIAFFMFHTGLRISAIEKKLEALAGNCQQRKPKAPLVSIALAALLVVSIGCVQTRVKIGEAELSRTAVLTTIDVPTIEVATNGTFKASVKSDARTEALEALARAILSVPK